MGSRYLLQLAIGVLLALGFGEAGAQEPSYRSAEEIRAELARLDGVTARAAERAGNAERRVAAAVAEAARLRERQRALVQRSIALVERPLAPGADLTQHYSQRAEASAERARILGELEAASDALTQALSTRQAYEKVAREAAREGRLAATRRTALLLGKRLELEPAYLKSVELVFRDPRDGSTQTLYRGEWVSDESSRRMEDAMRSAGAGYAAQAHAVESLERSFVEAERAFVDASRRWQGRLADFKAQVGIGGVVHVTNMALEAADVGISVASGGWGAVLFEGAYRTAENTLKGWSPPSKLPKVSDEILAARERFAQEDLRHVQSLVDLERAEAPPGEFADALVQEGGAEIFKNLVELRGGAVTEAVADLLDKTHPDRALVSRLSVNSHLEAVDRVLARANDALATGQYWRDAAKGLGIGLATTFAKEGVKALNEAETAEIFNDMARLELEWFVRRRALRAINQELRYQRRLLEAFRAAFDAVRQRRDTEVSGQRRLQVSEGRDRIVLANWQRQHLGLNLVFSANVPHASSRIGGGAEVFSSGSDRHFAKLSDQNVPPAGGMLDVRARTVGVQFHDRADGFDANPATFARLQPDLTWEDREEGADHSHKLSLATPRLQVVSSGESGVAPGDQVEIEYLAPSSAGEEAWLGAVVRSIPKDLPDTVAHPRIFTLGSYAALPGPATPGGKEGRHSIKAPPVPGTYEVRVYDRREKGRTAALALLCVRDPGAAGADAAECLSIVGHWRLTWAGRLNPTDLEFVLADQPEGPPTSRGPAGPVTGEPAEPNLPRPVYHGYTPTQAGANGPPRFECTRDGSRLVCRMRGSPRSPTCPDASDGFSDATMTIAPDGKAITGENRWSTMFSLDDCAWGPLRVPVPPMAFTLTRKEPPTAR